MKAKNILLLFFIISFLAGCNEYEEGPDISFRTVKQRLCGEWIVERLTVDGADSLLDFMNHPGYREYYVFTTDKGNSAPMSGYNSGYTDRLAGSWSLNYNEEFISFGNANPYGPVFNSYINWKIIRLSNKEMWFETTFINYKNYEIRFKAK